jgi:hypothetical protein
MSGCQRTDRLTQPLFDILPVDKSLPAFGITCHHQRHHTTILGLFKQSLVLIPITLKLHELIDRAIPIDSQRIGTISAQSIRQRPTEDRLARSSLITDDPELAFHRWLPPKLISLLLTVA